MLRTVPANVMISGYPSALYDELLAGWRSIQFQVMTHGGPRTEKLWMIFTEGSAFAGTNYIDRQRIKRKAERWAKNYSAMPSAEQAAILAEILNWLKY